MSPEELVKPLPAHSRSLTSSVEPLLPCPRRRIAQVLQRTAVTVHAEVVVVPFQLARKRLMLLLDRVVPMTSAPLGDSLTGPPEARTTSPECHPPRSPPRPLPVQREAEEVEGRATPFAPLSGRSKGEAAGLLRVEGQAKCLEPFLENAPHVRRVVRMFEAQHEVICIPDERTARSEMRTDLALEPRVKDVVQIDVPEQR